MKVWNDQEYFRRNDDKISVPAWAVNIVVLILIVLVIVAGVKLINARKQLQSIERHIYDCKGGRVGNLLMMPTKDCSAKSKIAIIEYKGGK